MKMKKNISSAVTYLILLVGAAWMLIPFLWMVLTSFKTYKETVMVPIQWFPARWNFDNYREVLSKLQFSRYYANTILVTICTLIPMTFLATLSAYAFSRMNFAGKNILFGMQLIVFMVPAQMTMVPKYMMIAELGWVDKLPGIVVPQIFSVYTMFMMRQFFTSVPADLDAAAKIDGCSYFGIFWRIDLPLVKNGLLAMTILNLLSCWNDLLWPLISTSTDKMRVLSVAMATINNTDSSKYHILMAAGVLSILPMLVLYAVFQKYFIEGIASAGVKG